MKCSLILIAFIAAISAVPTVDRAALDACEANELEDGRCKDVTFIFARGTYEPGNMGVIVGPQTCAALKAILGEHTVACQGVGPPYYAAVNDNYLPQNTSPSDIGAATTLFGLANSKCPKTKIIAGGYSQGSAVMDGAIQALPDNIKSQVYGVVLFGFTRNVQDDGRIPNYPTNQTKVFCHTGDVVCVGILNITGPHLTYAIDAPAAAEFLADLVC